MTEKETTEGKASGGYPTTETLQETQEDNIMVQSLYVMISSMQLRFSESDSLRGLADFNDIEFDVMEESMQVIREENEKKKQKEKMKTVGPIQIFRFAEGLDIFYMSIGFLGAMVNGVCHPIMLIVLGEMADSIVCYNSSLQNTSECLQFKPLSEQMTVATSLPRFSLYYAGIGAAVIIFGYFQVSLWVLAAARQTRKMRKLFFHSVLSQEMSWFDVTKSGELNTRLTEDVNKINDGIGDKVGHLAQNCSTFVAGLVIALYTGWKLALVIMATSPLVAISTAICSKMVVSLTSKELSAYAKAGAVAEEVLSSIRTVVAFGGQEKEIKRYTNNLGQAKEIGIRKAITSQMAVGFMYFFIYATYALGFWYGTTLILGGQGYTIGKTLVVFFSVVLSSFCIGQAASHFEAFSVARGAAHNIFDIIDQTSTINSFSTEGYKPDHLKGNIEFQNVHFCYPSRSKVQVLKGLNLKVKSGQMVALVGQSGCGKSTTVQLLQRLYDPQEGTIVVDGHDIQSLNVQYFREFIGVVSQEPVLFATTIKQNIKYGRLDVTNEEIETAAKEANAYDFIMALPDKFETLVGERGAQLSGGQKQRIAIARALVRNPKILLLDEATSALDTESESVVQAALDKASKGRTTIVIAHRLSTIWTADLIVVLENGAVAEQGTHSELLEKKGTYHSLATAQSIQTAEGSEPKDKDQGKPSLIQRLHSNMSNGKYSKSEAEEEEEITEDTDKEKLPKISFFRLLKLNKSEWPYIMFGTLAAIINGAVHPGFSILYAKIIAIFGTNNPEIIRNDINLYSIIIAVIGVASFFTYFIQGFMFGRSGEVLTMRLRQMAFKSMLRQEISWFDNKKHNTGALTTKLATDASQIQTNVHTANYDPSLTQLASLISSWMCHEISWLGRIATFTMMMLPKLMKKAEIIRQALNVSPLTFQLFDGIDAKCLNVQWLRSQIGIVSQEPVLFDCSIAENIAYGNNSREVSMEEIQQAAISANIHSFIESLPEKFNTPVGGKGTQLSGGQKQRIAIARALIRAPKILLLDEATSALDNESEKVVQQALDQARKGRTCIMIAHRLSTVQNADLIVVMKNGRIIEQGTHQHLLAKQGAYYDLVNAQTIT
ncbi:ATP-binding cassette sub-family B member 5-like [Pseudophryne corroboree]|uniref:ATP-binding cassette sub-family B member 5-like n=1 Tax=Pseudophryne corroboree TaxID=495146 RepID=UPI003081B64A